MQFEAKKGEILRIPNMLVGALYKPLFFTCLHIFCLPLALVCIHTHIFRAGGTIATKGASLVDAAISRKPLPFIFFSSIDKARKWGK